MTRSSILIHNSIRYTIEAILESTEYHTVGKIQLKITPSLAGLFNVPGHDWFTIEKEIGEHDTIGQLLSDLTRSYPDLGGMIFDSDSGEGSDQILVVLNDSLLQSQKVSEAELRDGDSITLLPVYAGG